MKKTLEVGDVLYNDKHYIRRIVISRVTKTQAISGTTRLPREYKGEVKEIGTNGWEARYWKLETEELKKRYERSYILAKIKNTNFKEFTTEKLKEILSVINREPEVDCED